MSPRFDKNAAQEAQRGRQGQGCSHILDQDTLPRLGQAEAKKGATRERPVLRPHGGLNNVLLFNTPLSLNGKAMLQACLSGGYRRARRTGQVAALCKKSSMTSRSRGQRSPSLPRGFHAHWAASGSSHLNFTLKARVGAVVTCFVIRDVRPQAANRALTDRRPRYP